MLKSFDTEWSKAELTYSQTHFITTAEHYFQLKHPNTALSKPAQ